MGFNRKDLQDDDDFNFDDGDDFNFDDKPNGDDFKFDDDAPDIDLDDGKDTGFGFESDDMPELNEEGSPPTRTNRTFIYIAALMIILFLIGLGAVLYLSTRDNGPSVVEQTRSAIETQNADTQILLNQTGTAAVQIAFDQTGTASVPTATPTSEPPTREPTFTPTPPEPTIDATQQFANALLTQVANEATQTAAFLLITPTVIAPNQDAVAATGTALAILLGSGGGVPVNDVTGGAGNNLTATAIVAINNVPSNELTATAISTILGTPSNNLTATAVAVGQVIPGNELTSTSLAGLLGASSNDLTSTAIAGIFGTPSNGMTATARAILAGFPTQEIALVPTRLPQTGFFDDVGAGNNVGLIALLALGLVGVIGVTRVVRATNK